MESLSGILLVFFADKFHPAILKPPAFWERENAEKRNLDVEKKQMVRDATWMGVRVTTEGKRGGKLMM